VHRRAPERCGVVTTTCARAATGQTDSTATTAATEFQEAGQLQANGQLDEAMVKIDAFLAKRPKDARGRFLKGMIFTQQKSPMTRSASSAI
jgi:hypothetical protein